MKKTISRTTRNKSKRAPRKSSMRPKRKTRVRTAHGAIDIQNGLGGMKTALSIAKSLKQAADASEHLTTAPFQAAMAALEHLIEFLDRQRARLEAAKNELRRLYGEIQDDDPEPGNYPSGRGGLKGKGGRSRKPGGKMVVMSA